MKLRLMSAVVAVAFFGVSGLAMDYAPDTSFAPVFSFHSALSEPMGEVLVQADGKVLVGGAFYAVNGEASNFIVRLNPDGSRDTTFNSPFVHGSGFINRVWTIRELPGGKLFVTGDLKIGENYTSYAKLNSDGSIDNSMSEYAPVGRRIEPLADGKFVVCGGRMVGPETYWLSHRLNADGSVDPSYRVTIGEGSCQDIAVLPDGKILLAGFFHTPNNAPLPGIQRFHPDGTLDTSFNLQSVGTNEGFREIAVMPDGKVVAPSCCRQGLPAGRAAVDRFHTDGSHDLYLPHCGANPEHETAMLPLADGNLMMSGCQKWQNGVGYQFAELLPDGRIVPSLDRIAFDLPVTDIFSGLSGEYYVLGRFTEINDVPLATLARLKPYVAPIKPKFDFDGDGRSDLAVFRPSDRYWYLNRSSAGFGYFQWGLPTDKLIAANYDADDMADIGVYRSDGRWMAWTAAGEYSSMSFGPFNEDDVRPFAGDFDGDKKQDWALRRKESGQVTWYVTLNSQRGWTHETFTVPGETMNDTPVIADLDGDGREEIGFYRDGDWFVRDYAFGAPVNTFHWGSAGDIPLPGDYDADGIADFAIFRPSTGDWWINRSRDGVFVLNFGLAGDIPVPADYDGDTKLDIAIFRDGQWWQYLTNAPVVQVERWGAPGDIPIPAQAQ